MADAALPPVWISALHYEWSSVQEAFGRAATEFGLDGIEFSICEGAGRPHLLEAECEPVAALAAQYRLGVAAHAWGELPVLGAQGAVAQLRRWLALSVRMGSRYLIVHGGVSDDRQAGLALMADVFAAVADDYAAAGVTLCVENHYAWEYRDCHELYGTAEELGALFARVLSPGLGFCLDYGHSHMSGNTLQLLHRVSPRLVYTHLADNLGEHDDHLMFGDGTVPWREVLTATKAAGYHGPLTIEFPVRESTEGLRRFMAMMRWISV
jgi:sugar phosphate isomerase/epimerase